MWLLNRVLHSPSTPPHVVPVWGRSWEPSRSPGAARSGPGSAGTRTEPSGSPPSTPYLRQREKQFRNRYRNESSWLLPNGESGVMAAPLGLFFVARQFYTIRGWLWCHLRANETCFDVPKLFWLTSPCIQFRVPRKMHYCFECKKCGVMPDVW